MKAGERAAARWCRVGVIMLAALALGLASDLWREERVLFPRKAPPVRRVPGVPPP